MQALKAVNPIVDLLQLSLELGDIPANNATRYISISLLIKSYLASHTSTWL